MDSYTTRLMTASIILRQPARRRAIRRGSMRPLRIHRDGQGVLNRGQIELAEGWNTVLALRLIDASAGFHDGWRRAPKKIRLGRK